MKHKLLVKIFYRFELILFFRNWYSVHVDIRRKNAVIIIDTSMSMAIRDVEGSRLDLAKNIALRIISSLRIDDRVWKFVLLVLEGENYG